MPTAKKKVVIKPVEVPPELADKVNPVKSRMLFLSPSVLSGEERECRKDDFESLANSNIGVGGFGKVYKVRHKVSKNVFAIKVINKKKILEHDLVEQIKLEVRIMYKLNHDHILKLYNHYEDDDNFYLILQYCAKGQIYSLLKKEGRFSEKLAAQYLRECISAVQYLHSLEPPIIHRDIKPENILLDVDGVVKLADFGWSNYFDDDNRRLTYCGTPEYLAPEMIKQSGHDKALDVWNLGVLLFELLTGNPPFEGKRQEDLFNNILALKIKWPKGFNGIAKDLISKLLKIDPKHRIPVNEITEHPWFKSVPQIRPVVNIQLPKASSNLLDNPTLEKQDYQVVSKPSVANKAEANEENTRQSIIDKKLNKVKKLNLGAAGLGSGPGSRKGSTAGEVPKPSATTVATTSGLESARAESALVQDLQQKLQKYKKEAQDTKYEYLKKCSEVEARDKKIAEQESLISELKKYHDPSARHAGDASSSQGAEMQIKALKDEVARLKSLNKNRDDILTDLEQKNHNLRETETQLKLHKNDIEIYQTRVKTFEKQNVELTEKCDSLEQKLAQMKEAQLKTQKEKDQLEISLNNQIEMLQYKLLSGGERDGSRVGSMSAGMQDSAENTFKELLKLCRGDLQDITNRLKNVSSNYEVTEDQLRSDIIEQGRKMNELRQEHERQSFDIAHESDKKLEQMQRQKEQQMREMQQRHREELAARNDRIKELERQQQRDKMLGEQAESLRTQLEEMKDIQKMLDQDRNIIAQDKVILSEKVAKLSDENQNMKDQLHALNRQGGRR